jgi:hypothetical protein
MGTDKVSEEVALEEVKSFAEYHLDRDLSTEKVKEDYPDVIRAVQRGLLTFDEDQVPKLTLKEPVKGESGAVALDSVSFKTRIVASEQQKLAKGVDMKNDTFALINKFRAYFIGQPVLMLDKLGKTDYKVVDQLTSVFL